jgi:hypothetical protein
MLFPNRKFSTDSVENSVENYHLKVANFCSVGTFSALHTYCSNSVYMTKLTISTLIVEKRDFIGFFESFVTPRFWFNCRAVQNSLKIVQKLRRNHTKAYQLIKIFFEPLAQALAEIVSRAEHFSRFRAFRRPYETFAFHHIQNLCGAPVAYRKPALQHGG